MQRRCAWVFSVDEAEVELGRAGCVLRDGSGLGRMLGRSMGRSRLSGATSPAWCRSSLVDGVETVHGFDLEQGGERRKSSGRSLGVRLADWPPPRTGPVLDPGRLRKGVLLVLQHTRGVLRT